MTTRNWFTADDRGLAKLVEDRPKVFVLHELISNAWDTETDVVDVTLEKLSGRPAARLVVRDEHPEGFKFLDHAWTLFADSEKKGDPTTRGRLNMGEKLVLALCESATITTTKGCVAFDDAGRHRRRLKTDKGSVFDAIIRMNQAEYDAACVDVMKLIPPGVTTTFNGQVIQCRDMLVSFEATLPTELADETGVLRRRERKTVIEVYKPLPGETPAIYEMGIPVVELKDDLFHINVMQKTPISMQRDNLPPSYVRKLRGLVLEHVALYLNQEESAAAWVTNALEEPGLDPIAVRTVIQKRFGEKAAVFDPTDLEANNRLVERGFHVVHGRSLPAAAWENVRAADALPRSGVIAPTPKPYSSDPNATRAKLVPPSEYTDAVAAVVDFAEMIGRRVMGLAIKVTVVNAPENNFAACYGAGELDLNLGCLTNDWFEFATVTEIVDLIVHEYAHQYERNHLSEGYHDAATRLGGQCTALALEDPGLFQRLRAGRLLGVEKTPKPRDE